MPSDKRSDLATSVRKRLRRAMPEPRCELRHDNAWQLLIATILSAQSTDKTVNRVTPALFARFPDPASLAAAKREEVEALVKSTGFFRNKAKAIQRASQHLVDHHDGAVPVKLKQLVKLPGVARKTANLVLGTGFGKATGIIVDTHAGRVARRLGLSSHSDPVKVEADLCGLFHKRSWIGMGHRLVLHGRYICTKRTPACGSCPLAELCPSAEQPAEGRWTQRADAQRERVTAGAEATLSVPPLTPT